MSKPFSKRIQAKREPSVVFIVMFIILIIAIPFFLMKPVPFLIIAVSILGVLILLCRVYFKHLAINNPEAFNLLIAMVSVIIGVYLGITASQIANEKEEKNSF